MTTTAAKRAGQQGKSIEEVLHYALGHKIRVEILILLNEGSYTPAEIAEIIGEPLNKVANHIRELLDAGSIEVADIRRRRNTVQHVYRTVETPYYSDEDMAAMTPTQRQVIYGLVIQSMMAEVMASLWAGKIRDDPRPWIAWDWMHLDPQGRQDIADEQERSWQRMCDIQLEALDRAAASGEATASFIVGQLGFERARRAPKPARSADGE